MISIKDLSFAYPGGEFRLDIPALEIAQGERVAVVGPSGTGKTTLLNLIAGIVAADSGSITVGETRIDGLSNSARRAQRAAEIGFIFQNFALLDYLSAEENILYPYRIADGLTLDAAARDRARTLAAASGLANKLRRLPAALSQGEQQRVAICRALVTEPKLLLADEATGNLDPDNKAAILDLLFAQAQDAGATLLAVTHDHELLPRFDRVIDFATFRTREAA